MEWERGGERCDCEVVACFISFVAFTNREVLRGFCVGRVGKGRMFMLMFKLDGLVSRRVLESWSRS